MMTIDGAATGEIGNRNSINKPLKPSGQRDWSFGIFDCFSAHGTFFFACCFPCLVFSKNNFRLRHLNMLGDVHPASGNIVRNVSWWLTPVMTLNPFGSRLRSAVPSVSLMVSRYVPAPHVLFTWLSAVTSAIATTLKEMRSLTCMFHQPLSFPTSLTSVPPVFVNSLWVCCCGPCALTQESREIELEVQDSLTESLTAFFCSCRSTARPSLPNHPAVPTPRTLPNLPSIPSALSALGRRPPGPEQNPSSDSGKA